MDNFKSINENDLPDLIADFIKLKRAMGLKYISEAKQLRYFSRFCNEQFPNSELPVDALKCWLFANPNAEHRTIYGRMCTGKIFAQYLFSLGYIPLTIPLMRFSNSTAFTPHIFTADEITAVWKTADNIPRTTSAQNMPRMLPVLLRLLYSSGLRISEAVALNGGDVDLVKNVITVRRSKNERERLIPLSDSMTAVLQKYTDDSNPAICEYEPFFYFQRGIRLNQSSIYNRFRMILRDSGIPYRGRLRGPRLHDLRHTFSVNAMNKLVDDGSDLYVILPILSSYLGHANVGSTERYVRLTEARLSNITDDVSSIIPNIFPEVKESAEI